MPSTAPLVEGTGKKSWHQPALPEEDGTVLKGTGVRPHVIEELPHSHQEGPRTMGRVTKANIKVDVAKGADDQGGKRL